MINGDGACDDHQNIPECNFDGGDCCGDEVTHGYCSKCLCIGNHTESKFKFYCYEF